jgi:DNA polymerase III delta prime subunit
LDEPEIVSDAIKYLVMPEKTKEMIKGIVKTYANADSQAEHFSADYIRGKGEGSSDSVGDVPQTNSARTTGQIFLLHGPPGTGKTLTAGGYCLS